MKKISILISYLIAYFVCNCIGKDDRNISFIDAKKNMNINTFSCPDANSVQFKTTFFGPFDTNTLDQSGGFNVAYFEFDILVPHFQREVIIDIVFMRSFPSTTLTFLIDGNPKREFLSESQQQFKEFCNSKQLITYKEFEQFFRFKFQSFNQVNKSIVHISESKKKFIDPGLMISSIQLNVSPCHPSCLTCKDQDKNSCLSCSQNATLDQGTCTCNKDYYFQDGQCVASCNNKNYYHYKDQKESTEKKVCTFINQCTQWQNEKCQACQSPMLPQQDICVSNCSSGFIKVKNKKSNLDECLLSDRFKQVSTVISAFHSNSFSGIEVESISGLNYSGFLQQFAGFDSYVSKCNQYQLFGGFFINQINSKITYTFSAANSNFVKVYFKYIFIDISAKGNAQITVKLNDQSLTIQVSQSKDQIDICGFSDPEFQDNFTLYSALKPSNQLNITNEGNSYLGIRELSIYTFNCLQDNCQNCTVSNKQTICQQCIPGYYQQKGECIQCNPMCLTCSDSLSCNNCLPVQGLTLNESKQCVCQDYFYFDSTNIICKQCLSATCLTCKENSDQCLSCQKPLALLGTECVSSCGNGKAVNQSTNQCALCINNCLNCDNNLSSCNQCQNGFYFLNNKCISACPDGYYSDQKNAKCIPCFQSECINCIQSYDICTKCNNNSYVDINTYQCVSQCSNTQYDDQGYCKNCSELYTYCISCNLKQQCTQCSNNLILSVNSQQCLQSCPQGTVQKGQQCIQCSNNCSQCDINLICQVCSSGFYLYQEECYQSCPSGYYPDLYNQCQPCSSVFNNCQTCSATECLSCDTSSNHQYLDINKTQCLQQCDIGQFFDSQMQCQLCQNSCATCDSSNTSFCKSCDPNNSIGDIFLTEDGKCVSQCPSEFYADANNICLRCNQKFANCVACNAQICLQCEANYCLNIDAHLQSSTCDGPTTVCTSNTCTNINNCLICNNGQCQVCSQNYFLIDDKCDQCAYPGTPSKYFTNYQKQTCDLCSTKFGTDCLECDQNSCTKCQPTNQYIYKNKCENQCGDGYYANSEYNCQPCLNNNCLTCDPNLPKNCLSCPTFGKILLQNNDCVIQCAEGFFQNQNICQLCPANCSNCKSSTQCLKCQDNFLIDVTQSQCIENKCPSGQYKGINTFGSNACFECSQLFFNCTECTQNSCQQCEMPLYLYNNTCNDSCPDNYYPDKNNNCQQCPISKKCKTCNASNCLSCFQNSQYPYLDENGICVSQCKSNQYLKQLTINSFVCTSCSSDFGTSCQQCNSQSCLKCESPQFISELDNNSCVTDCPPGQYGSEETNLCQNCENTRCSKCKFDKNNPSQCTQCMKEYPYLYQGECLSECQEGYFPDLDNNCQSCSSKYDPNCNQCDSEVCHSCSPSSDLFLYNNTCVESCPDFYYPSYQDIKECKVCLDSNCKQCNFLDPSKCLSCSGSYLFNETCVATCPFGTFVNQQENKCAYCFSQFSSCQECTEKSCISCINNLFILEDIQQCVSSCPFNYIDSSLIVNSPQSNLNSNLSNKKTCQKCDNQNCNTCDPRDTKKCLSCPQTTDNSPNQYLYNQDCIQNCDFYVNFATNECFDSCPNYLLQLEQPKSCQECPQFIQSRECVKECTSNTYIDQIHQKLCVVCQDQYDTNCILCNSQQCSKCSQGFYLYKNKCYSQCPENTFIDNENYNCLDKCTYPLVIINSNVCSKACPLGQFKEPINMQDEIICGICDEKCIECTDKSSFCTVCSQGSGWDCLDKEDFHKFIRNQHYESSRVQNCE
ncbi:zinc finger lsd1 subclass family protein (macronuclear) [Tetrahymena thermophila SB210]|uniref:Zinc finger lsd1 subclass family protein n=1 Tax=Tetrahymena thermophila (strain SB210) TaxID=312017 RepID=I7LU73_TETTS|nr:zinc finger lsd1 subclass family protein [Tetrahymena thermophila SB210]EAR90733.2 zinc finger lsd1 subclass family protein [Tetrahymena thermophila SB210]|eukprot:XP_001010978.2 zinc finger lsd1 subclass family protein [Tetrahymena thermophila SB210]